jgi:hypothetical protein
MTTRKIGLSRATRRFKGAVARATTDAKPQSGWQSFAGSPDTDFPGNNIFNFPGNLAKRLKRWQYKSGSKLNTSELQTVATKACSPFFKWLQVFVTSFLKDGLRKFYD